MCDLFLHVHCRQNLQVGSGVQQADGMASGKAPSKAQAKPAWVNFATGASAALSGWMVGLQIIIQKIDNVSRSLDTNSLLLLPVR